MTGLNDALENVVVVKNYLYSQGDNWYADLLDEAADAIRKAISIAIWIWDRPHHFRCSVCNYVVGQMTYLYCPNCGREMLLSETERRKEPPEEVSNDDV